jgi:hypothetical protein
MRRGSRRIEGATGEVTRHSLRATPSEIFANYPGNLQIAPVPHQLPATDTGLVSRSPVKSQPLTESHEANPAMPPLAARPASEYHAFAFILLIELNLNSQNGSVPSGSVQNTNAPQTAPQNEIRKCRATRVTDREPCESERSQSVQRKHESDKHEHDRAYPDYQPGSVSAVDKEQQGHHQRHGD